MEGRGSGLAKGDPTVLCPETGKSMSLPPWSEELFTMVIVAGSRTTSAEGVNPSIVGCFRRSGSQPCNTLEGVLHGLRRALIVSDSEVGAVNDAPRNHANTKPRKKARETISSITSEVTVDANSNKSGYYSMICDENTVLKQDVEYSQLCTSRSKQGHTSPTTINKFVNRRKVDESSLNCNQFSMTIFEF